MDNVDRPSILEQAWELFLQSFLDPQFLLKVTFLVVTAPLWVPILKTIWEELNLALAPEGGVFGRMERTEVAHRKAENDPWINVPRAAHRARLRSIRGPARSGPTGARAGLSNVRKPGF